jgi:cell division septation protein DedD
MPKNSERPGELVLENRHLLLIFFAVVMLAGVFFALGYIVGRNTFSPSATSEASDSAGAEGGIKPSPMPPASYYLRDSAPVAAAPGPDAAPDLLFDQTLGEQASDARLESSPAAADPSGSPAPASPPRELQQANGPAVGPPPPGILVQVSALTRQQDAQRLVELLREKNLPVLVTTGTGDSLYHVVIGPYQSDAQAQQVKKSLEEDGFQPIIKR